jgi:ribosomal protein S18 acetylase RimI-like enzyme
MQVRRVCPDEWEQFRAFRLRALRDAPYAFEAVYADEEQLPDAHWQDVAATPLFVACDGENWLGITGAWVEPEKGVAKLWTVWVDPAARRRGVGRSLMQFVIEWAGTQPVDRILLEVGESNSAAMDLYVEVGFAPTRNRRPLESNPSITEIEMELRLAGDRSARL